MTNKIEEQRGLNAIKPYVPGTPIEDVKREYGIQDVIKLASNENPLGPSPKAVAAIEPAVSQLNLYPDGQSYYLRRALAKYLGFGIEPDQVAVGNGADGIIMQICLTFLSEDCDVIVSSSSFPVYDIYTHVMRAQLIKIPMKDFRLDLEAMASAVTDRTKVIFVCNPNNPTGGIVTAAEVDAFIAAVPDHVLLVFDEAYYELVDSDEFPETLAYIQGGRTNVMVMRTYSKAYGIAGLRLGYAVAQTELVAIMNKVKEPFAVNLLAQAAGIAALEDEAFLNKTVTTNAAGRSYLYAEFERLDLPYILSHTNFILVKLGPQALEIQQQLLRQGVIVRPCTGYDLPEYLRITVGDQSQNTRFINTLEEVLKSGK